MGAVDRYPIPAAARLSGMSVARVRAMIAAGIIVADRDEGGRAWLTFDDVRRLRQLRDVPAEVSAPRLAVVLDRVGPRHSRLRGQGRRLWVDDDDCTWEPESGQVVLRFGGQPSAPASETVAPPMRLPVATAAAHYERGRALEARDPAGACEAYRRALAIDPEHADANINLGRLVHESGQAEAAVELYRAALRGRPDDPVAYFNLGVALGDLSQLTEALAAYHKVLQLDPSCADAHYNAARVCERRGDRLGTVRHLRAYRSLQDG